MHVVKPLLMSIALGCAVNPTNQATQDPLPAPKDALRVPQFEAEGLTLGDLLREFALSTDQHLVMTETTRQMLTQTPVVIGGAIEIPAGEVYSFVEGLLYFHGFVTGQLKSGERPLLGVYGPREAQSAPRFAVPEEDLGLFKNHPAFMIQTVVDVPHIDTRQLSTSLRGLMTDTSKQTLLAVGDHGVLLAGTGKFVNELVVLVRAADEKARIRWEERKETQQEGESEQKSGAR